MTYTSDNDTHINIDNVVNTMNRLDELVKNISSDFT